MIETKSVVASEGREVKWLGRGKRKLSSGLMEMFCLHNSVVYKSLSLSKLIAFYIYISEFYYINYVLIKIFREDIFSFLLYKRVHTECGSLFSLKQWLWESWIAGCIFASAFESIATEE
jgi:hypothetical protein